MANCMQAVIGIGSNMGDRLKNINGAVRSLSRLPKTKITACSHVYETKPMGYEDQSMFYNAAVTVETELSAQMLLGACLGIEGAYGRIRTIKDGPRVLDLDLLLYEGMKSEFSAHPAASENIRARFRDGSAARPVPVRQSSRALLPARSSRDRHGRR